MNNGHFKTTHGLWTTQRRQYQCWQDMKQRCYNQKNHNYPNYGARGIIVCERWLGDAGFKNFVSDMGDMPINMTIDRKDANGNYEPSNCRWATRAEQRRNQRDCRYFTYHGETKTLEEWARTLNIHQATLRDRLKTGMSFSEAVTRPIRGGNPVGYFFKQATMSQTKPT